MSNPITDVADLFDRQREAARDSIATVYRDQAATATAEYVMGLCHAYRAILGDPHGVLLSTDEVEDLLGARVEIMARADGESGA